MASSLLEASGLHKRYRMGDSSLHVLRGVDMALSEGEWLAVLGQSGSGKSTLLHLLGGLDTPDSGEIRYRRQALRLSPRALDRFRSRDVGFVFQFYHLLPELTALENVLISSMVAPGLFGWAMPAREARTHAHDLLERLGLKERLHHRPSRLSGGERQRVAIARALVNRPPLLLADEPTGNLDPETGQQILDVFKQFHAQGQTIVMVTHDMEIARAADRRVRLVKGGIEG